MVTLDTVSVSVIDSLVVVCLGDGCEVLDSARLRGTFLGPIFRAAQACEKGECDDGQKTYGV